MFAPATAVVTHTPSPLQRSSLHLEDFSRASVEAWLTRFDMAMKAIEAENPELCPERAGAWLGHYMPEKDKETYYQSLASLNNPQLEVLVTRGHCEGYRVEVIAKDWRGNDETFIARSVPVATIKVFSWETAFAIGNRLTLLVDY